LGMKKNKGGRPTLFRKEYIEGIKEFFNREPMRKEVMETITEYNSAGEPRKTAEKYKYIPNKLPTIYQYAKHIGVDYWTVWNWAEKGEDEDDTLLDKLAKRDGVKVEDVELAEDLRKFSKAYKDAKAAQQEFLMEIGLAGAAPPAAYIFTAKNITPMRDKIEQEVTHREVKPLLEHLALQKDDDTEQ